MAILYPTVWSTLITCQQNIDTGDIPEFQPEFNSFVSEEEQERDALADLFSEDFSLTNKIPLDNANAPQELPPEGLTGKSR